FHNHNYSDDDIQRCINILQSIVDQSEQLAKLPEEQRVALLKVAGRLSRPDRDEFRKRKKDQSRHKQLVKTRKDREARATTGIRVARTSDVFMAPLRIDASDEDFARPEAELGSPRNCYVCKEEYTRLHFFYDSMCKKCGDFNYQKRFQTA